MTLLFLFSCGHFENGNPVGATGGGNSGYGHNNNSINSNENAIIGEWKYSVSQNQYYIIKFESNGEFTQTVYDYGNSNSSHGTYVIGYDRFHNLDYIVINDAEPVYFKIENNKLYILDPDGTEIIIYTRV